NPSAGQERLPQPLKVMRQSWRRRCIDRIMNRQSNLHGLRSHPGIDGVLQNLANELVIPRVLPFPRLLGLKQLGFVGITPDGGAAEFFEDPGAHGLDPSMEDGTSAGNQGSITSICTRTQSATFSGVQPILRSFFSACNRLSFSLRRVLRD